MTHYLPLVSYFGCYIFIIELLYNNASLKSFFLGEAALDGLPAY